ncbi:HEAT repeat domain-containing protein [Massilia sp. IC2-278]|uniref:HEAT repeat domain-containing protein n=1 Tax=Massilia sp. IC2-278 TaxID=2887200 RepID=UPI001E2BF708|nr:HEAT repeat domain-containing protein [Massilia sp. IC2-278]MCC2961130.1 HEAT repeat domain-containing protein [Massilia sp. IC2-278]
MNILWRIFGLLPRSGEYADSSHYTAWLEGELEALHRTTHIEQVQPYLAHRDGYIRQAAVEYCGRLAPEGAVARLVERLNDWVPQVRAAARRALEAVVPTASAADLCGALPAAYALLHAKRETHAQWVAAFERTIIDQAGAPALAGALQGRDIQVGRAVFRLLAGTHAMTPQALFALVVPASSDIVLTRLAFDHLERSEEGCGESELVRAFASKSTPIRARALRALIARGITRYVEDALFARQASLRAVAAAHLAGQGQDVAALYREALTVPGASPARIGICLAELGASRQLSCLDSINPFLHHPVARVRSRAAQAWLRLAPAERDEIALRVLADPAPELRVLLLQLVRKHGAYLPFEAVRMQLQAPADRALLWWFADMNHWDALGTAMWLAEREPDGDAALPSWYPDLADWVRWARMARRKPTDTQRGFLLPLIAHGGLRRLQLSDEVRASVAEVFAHAGLPFQA